MIVLPERMELVGVGDLQSAALNTRAQGYNAALDDVARLNRNAIPEELIERCIQHLDWDGAPEKDAYDYGQECDSLACELRALLGKEGE